VQDRPSDIRAAVFSRGEVQDSGQIAVRVYIELPVLAASASYPRADESSADEVSVTAPILGDLHHGYCQI
jgi:hypothetical protein